MIVTASRRRRIIVQDLLLEARNLLSELLIFLSQALVLFLARIVTL